MKISCIARLFNPRLRCAHSFSILHFQFSILHTPNSNKQQKKSGLPTALLYSEASACALFRAEFDFFALKDHICGAHGTHFTAHRAGMTLGRRNLFIKALRLFRVERKRKLRWPVQLVTCLRHRVVTVARARQAEGDIRRMCCDLARDDAFADVILVRQAQVLGRSDVADVSKSGRAGL